MEQGPLLELLLLSAFSSSPSLSRSSTPATYKFLLSLSLNPFLSDEPIMCRVVSFVAKGDACEGVDVAHIIH